MLINITKLKLTEKEINTIIYLSKSNKPVSINELQRGSGATNLILKLILLRLIFTGWEKNFKIFNDNEFIISKKNGYQIK